MTAQRQTRRPSRREPSAWRATLQPASAVPGRSRTCAAKHARPGSTLRLSLNSAASRTKSTSRAWTVGTSSLSLSTAGRNGSSLQKLGGARGAPTSRKRPSPWCGNACRSRRARCLLGSPNPQLRAQRKTSLRPNKVPRQNGAMAKSSSLDLALALP